MKKKIRHWTLEEIEYLENNWGAVSIKGIARKLKRSINSIKIKAYKLGLRRMIHSAEYITYNQLHNLIFGNAYGGSYDKKIMNAGFPLDTITIVSQKVKIVYMDKFWKWLENNKHLIDLKNTNSSTFGYEPKWVAEKRYADKRASLYKKTPWTVEEDKRLKELLKTYKYGYRGISIILKRTEGAIKRRMVDLKIKERPLRADNHTPWKDSEIEKVKDLYLKGYKSCVIAEFVNKSALAINGLLERHNYFKT